MKNKYEIKFNIGLETDLVVEGKDKLDATNILNDYYANGDLLEDFRRDYPNQPQRVAREVDAWISRARTDIMAGLKATNYADANIESLYRKYDRARYYDKRAGIEAFVNKYGRKPDFNNKDNKFEEDIINLTTIISKFPTVKPSNSN